MIIKTYDQGWGEGVPLKHWQDELLSTYLAEIIKDTVRTVVIHSTWYTKEFHDTVVQELEKLQPQRAVLISMLDPAIARTKWFMPLVPEVFGVGYYRGCHEIDAWALIVDSYFQEIDDDNGTDIDIAFMCLNRKPREHRIWFYNQLKKHDLVDKGIVSLGGHRMLNDDVKQGSGLAPNPGAKEYGIVNDIMSLGVPGNWRRCFLNIVTETTYDVDQDWFVSEKTYKPVVGSKPFLVMAPNGACEWLAHVGIVPYVDDFKDISDLDLRQPENLVAFLADLTVQPISYLQKKYIDLQPKIAYNKQMFFEHVNRTKLQIQRGLQCPA